MDAQERMERTLAFVREQLTQSPFFQKNPLEGVYRWDHTRRVAALGRQIARAEGLPEERLVLGCLLHDVSYRYGYETEELWQNHGRIAARMARPFLRQLGLGREETEEICYGIAIHVDDKADFDAERTVLAVTIGDCDNIDRMDAYRLYETLHRRVDYESVLGTERIERLRQQEARLEAKRLMPMATKTATELWQDRVDAQLDFYRRLRQQMEMGETFGDIWMGPV